MFIEVGLKACKKYLSGTFTTFVMCACFLLINSCDQIKADMEYRKKLAADILGKNQEQEPKSKPTPSTNSGSEQNAPELVSKNNIKKRTRPVYNKVILSRMQSQDGQQQFKRDAVLLDADQTSKDISIVTNAGDTKGNNDLKDNTTVTNNITDPAIQNKDINNGKLQNTQDLQPVTQPKNNEEFNINPKTKDVFKNNNPRNAMYTNPNNMTQDTKQTNTKESNPDGNQDINVFKDKDRQKTTKPVVREVEVERVSLPSSQAQASDTTLDSERAKSVKKSTKSYSVQAGSFALRDEADTFADKLSTISGKIYIQDAKIKDDKVYRVKIGPFNNQKQANDIMLKAIRSGYYDVFIVENNQ